MSHSWMSLLHLFTGEHQRKRPTSPWGGLVCFFLRQKRATPSFGYPLSVRGRQTATRGRGNPSANKEQGRVGHSSRPEMTLQAAQKLLQTITNATSGVTRRRSRWRGLTVPVRQLRRQSHHQAQSMASQCYHGRQQAWSDNRQCLLLPSTNSGALALVQGKSSSCLPHSWWPASQSWQGNVRCSCQGFAWRPLCSGSIGARATAREPSGSASADRQIYTVLYTYVENMLEKRVPHRPQHLALCQSLQDEGILLLGGALGNPPTDALLVLRARSAEEVEERLVSQDPYCKSGLVTSYKILPWTVVIGSVAKKIEQ